MKKSTGLFHGTVKIPTIHDYRSRYYGHGYTIHSIVDGGQILKASGWGLGLEDGDFLIMENGASSTRYRVKEVKYYADPTDMWSATLLFSPRTHAEAEEDAKTAPKRLIFKL